MDRVKAWEVLKETTLSTNVPWLTRASHWLDEGIDLVKEGNIIRLKNGTNKIGLLKNEKLLATNYTHGFEGNAVGEITNGCQIFKNGDQIYVKRVPDVSEFTVNERAILKAEPDAHCLEKHNFDVTDEALKLRASDGIAPNGQHVGSSGPPYPKQDGSKFNSANDIKRALEEVGPNTTRYQDALDNAIYDGRPSFSIEYTFPNTSPSLGYGFKKNSLEYIPEIRKVLVAYKRNVNTGEYYLVTMYPKIQ